MEKESYRLEAQGAKLLEKWKIAQQAAREQWHVNNRKFPECASGHGAGPTEKELENAEKLMRAQDDAWMLVEKVQAEFVAALREGR